MVVRDPVKSREYVSKYRAMMKANEETKKEYNKLNASYYAKHTTKEKEKLGTDEYHKERAEYTRPEQNKKKLNKMSLIQKLLYFKMLFKINYQETYYCNKNKIKQMKLYQRLTNSDRLIINNR